VAIEKPTPRERLKKVQALTIRACSSPLLPADVRACIAESVLLLSDLVVDVEKLKFYLDTLKKELGE